MERRDFLKKAGVAALTAATGTAALVGCGGRAAIAAARKEQAMIRDPDNSAQVPPVAGPASPRPVLADSLAVGAVRSIRVKRPEMPKVLLAAVREDVDDALGGEPSEVVSLLLRQLENAYHKHWQMSARAN